MNHTRRMRLIPLIAFNMVTHALAQMAASHPQPQVQPKGGAPVADFVDVAVRAGLTVHTNIDSQRTRHINEMTGGGVALVDYDGDGWLDIFIVNCGPANAPAEQLAMNHLYRNNHDGSFVEVTEKAGLLHHGWSQGVSVGDYNGDGWPDLFVTYYGKNVLYRNNSDGTFTDVTKATGLLTESDLFSTGSAFVDYDRDGHMDLFVAHYVAYEEATSHDAGNGDSCKWRGIPVLCGPRGLRGTTDTLYRNRGDSTFEDVSGKAGIPIALNYGFTPLIADYNNDGWPDIYVANDSTPSLMLENNKNGTFAETGVLSGVAYNEDGREQSGMGADVADFNGDGLLDIVKTNFEQDTSTLYLNRGNGTFDDITFPGGLGVNTSFVGWGTGFLDFDNDGWPDILMANGHIYPEVDALHDTSFPQRKILYRNKGDGSFEDVSLRGGAGLLLRRSSRGAAFGDLFNSGQTNIVVNNPSDRPTLLVNRMAYKGHSLTLHLVGNAANPLAIGARATLTAAGRHMISEVRSGGSYLSQNDLRLRFGLGEAAKVDQVEIRWPDGRVDKLTNVAAGAIVTVQYGGKMTSTPYRTLPSLLQ
ncbi:VCBS repeat protein [Edaphobacter modestus]|uniref:VCBS repeat protein n=2 Tax=Edaphobacter modestus TaxID=388466 RepID=A0A4Q7YPA4_9BACT|nr:VCBS repeat protein [Edaphobacter modestus]